jgi:hypothetical protein
LKVLVGTLLELILRGGIASGSLEIHRPHMTLEGIFCTLAENETISQFFKYWIIGRDSHVFSTLRRRSLNVPDLDKPLQTFVPSRSFESTCGRGGLFCPPSLTFVFSNYLDLCFFIWFVILRLCIFLLVAWEGSRKQVF